jgi:hypothetical protein
MLSTTQATELRRNILSATLGRGFLLLFLLIGLVSVSAEPANVQRESVKSSDPHTPKGNPVFVFQNNFFGSICITSFGPRHRIAAVGFRSDYH